MAEYTDREELRMAMASVCSDPTCPMHIAAEIEQIIDCAPAADVAPVVHCKDCVHCGFCGEATNLEVMGFYGFCSRGKRRDGETK